MKAGAPRSFGARLKTHREAAGFTQEELATIAGLSVHAVSALERGERRRPHLETVRALSAALDLTGAARDAFLDSARAPAQSTAVDELSGVPLPQPLTALLGRDSDMQTLRHWLTEPVARLVTLTGPGGVGKTRLALELARAIAAEGAARVVFVPLAAIRNPAFVSSAIAEAMGLSDGPMPDLPGRARVAYGDQPTLLVLDNFEQVMPAAPLVADLLTAVKSLRVLATSRAPLRIRGERQHAVGPLEVVEHSDAMSPADLARSPAVRLFIERVQDGQPNFRLTPVNGPTVVSICRRLDALPLALELAAPWMKVLTPEDLLGRLAKDVLLSTVRPRDLPERQQTMNATVAWSYQLLAPNEQRAFRRLGVLPGRFPLEAVIAVLAGDDGSQASSDEALSAAASLIDKSLLLRAETAVVTRPLYQMLETVRGFAALELTATGERGAALEGLVRYCLDEASALSTELGGPAQVNSLDRVGEDLETYRSALAWLVECGRSVEAANIGWGLMGFWLMRGHLAEGLDWYEQTLNLPSIPPDAESRALVGAALMCYGRGELGPARTALTRALAIARAADDFDVTVSADNLLGHVEQAAGNLNVARSQFALSLDGFRTMEIPWGIGNALSGMAEVALAGGDAGEAERLLVEATAVLRHAGPWFIASVVNLRALLAVRRGDADEALALVRESLTHIRELKDKFAFVYALVPLAAAAALKRDDTWAAQILGARDAVSERTGATADKWVEDVKAQAEREVRARLGVDRWARAYAAGRVTSIDSLLADIGARS